MMTAAQHFLFSSLSNVATLQSLLACSLAYQSDNPKKSLKIFSFLSPCAAAKAFNLYVGKMDTVSLLVTLIVALQVSNSAAQGRTVLVNSTK